MPWDVLPLLLQSRSLDEAGIPYPIHRGRTKLRQIADCVAKDHDGDGRIDQSGRVSRSAFSDPKTFLGRGARSHRREVVSVWIRYPEAHGRHRVLSSPLIVDNASPPGSQMPGMRLRSPFSLAGSPRFPGPTYLMHEPRATMGALDRVPHAERPDRYSRYAASWDGIAIYPGSDKKDLRGIHQVVLSRQAQHI